jgi:4-hydroxy-2-oxovalerate aldolase
MKMTKILDTTLRDGSYPVNFQFSAEDTYQIASCLAKAGIHYIETGHGLGLGASRKNLGIAAETDEAYMEATARAVPNSNWGMFCIPSIASLEDIDKAHKFQMGFLRVGFEGSQCKSSWPYIERARELGMFVFANIMKSYCYPPQEFANIVKEVEEFGAQAVYVVDSAGGMTPEILRQYFRAIQSNTSIHIGFHGHDNLGLALANSLAAIDLDAMVVDTSIQGLGRGAGNTSTELLLSVLSKMGVRTGIDLFTILDIGEEVVVPRSHRKKFESLEILFGLAEFHSGFFTQVKEVADKFQIDVRRLIIALTKVTKTDAPQHLLDQLAAELKKEISPDWSLPQ